MMMKINYKIFSEIYIEANFCSELFFLYRYAKMYLKNENRLFASINKVLYLYNKSSVKNSKKWTISRSLQRTRSRNCIPIITCATFVTPCLPQFKQISDETLADARGPVTRSLWYCFFFLTSVLQYWHARRSYTIHLGTFI